MTRWENAARSHAPEAPKAARSLDLVTARVAFRDRSFIDVLDLALRFVVVHAPIYARVALVVLVPCLAIAYAAARGFGPFFGIAAAIVLSFFADVPFTVLASRVVFQENVRAREVLRAAATDMPRIVVARTMWLALIVLSGLFLLFPAVLVAIVFVYVNEVMLLERAPIFQAVNRSKQVAGSSIADAMLGVLTCVLVPIAATLLFDVAGRALLSELLQFKSPEPFWEENGSAVLALLGFLGALPYVATARFFVYLNVRTRVEGWDIQTRFAAIAARAERQEAA